MDLFFSVAEKRLAASVAFVWTFFRFGLTALRFLRGYLWRATARRRHLRRSSRVDRLQPPEMTGRDNATANQT
ncbi:hypothetical protein FQN51_002522 [Onygenales sp. PD_10]|nr:hypothetical protein FQN51_002522 [Onygenales sp. PD_10]